MPVNPVDEAAQMLIPNRQRIRRTRDNEEILLRSDEIRIPSISQPYSLDPTLRQQQWWIRLLSLTTVIVATCFSTVVGVLRLRAYMNTGELFKLVESYRVTVQVLITIISYVLGALTVIPICGVLNFHSRLSLTTKDHSLNYLRLWSAFSRAAIDWNLPFLQKAGTITFWALTLGPSYIWTGALTP